MAARFSVSCLVCALLLLLNCGFLLPAPQVAEAATEYNRYLAHLFRKYGNGGTMSFEGLEHLMYNLGLGQIEFDATHTIEQHYPNGFKKTESEANPELRSYFEQQTTNLLTGEENDVQMTNAGTPQPKQLKNNEDNIEVLRADSRDIVLRDKGIILEFKEMHDPKHRHPREHDATFDAAPLSSNVCLSPKSLLNLVVNHDDLHKRKLYKTVSTFSTGTPQDGHDSVEEYNEFINNVKLTPVAFMKLCPALLAQIDNHVCMRPAPLTHGEDSKELIWNAWIYASASIFILSACGLFGILLVPLMKSAAYQEILKFLVAIAVGTLSGDALMHLLPHALVPEEHDAPSTTETAHGHDNKAVWICACAFFTAVFMYILENLLPLLKGVSGHNHGHAHGGHGHSHNPMHIHGSGQVHSHGNSLATPAAIASSTDSVAPVGVEAKEINVMLDELKKDMKSPSRPLTPVAFMVIVGDGLHNLTDGLAIGAAFASDPVTGMATAFAVLCHELPHELGDFALLLQTGVSLKRAVCMNIVSSVLSFVGMAVGLLIAGVHSNMTQWIYAGTAGSFLYIALADLIPAMAAESKHDLKDALIQIAGIVAGGLIMLLIAVNEEQLELLFQ